MSTLKVNNIEDLDGNEQYTCKAWVNFDGTTTPPTIRASGNVSSVVRNATGDYTVNFTNSIVDGNYGIGAVNDFAEGATRNWPAPLNIHTRSSSSLRVLTHSSGTGDAHNLEIVTFVIFR